MEPTYPASVTQHEADLVALALDSFLGSNALSEEDSDAMLSLLLQFDYIADPESFLQYATMCEFEEHKTYEALYLKEKILDKHENVILVDFRKE